jgi:colanic acid biosynthesis glycosyl transferase WcaI
MNVLFFNQFFWPDSSATSQLLTDLARELCNRGHQVTVVCTDGGYAPSAAGDLPGIRIERVKALPFVRGRVGRLLSYLSFYPAALLRALSLPRPDLVVSLTTPPLINLVGSIVKALRGSPHLIWEMDLYPDVAVELNYLKPNGVVHRLTASIADFSRRHCDGIIALGACMKARLTARGIDPRKIVVAENWADGKAIHPYPRLHDQDQLVLLYSGNLGLAHDVETIAGAILRLREDHRFRFVFVGGGSRRPELAALAQTHQIHSIKLLPYAPREGLGRSLAAGDIGLVTQLDASCGTVVPSKIYGILAAGRPVLFIGPSDATPARIIERFQCGWQIGCGDVDSLTHLLTRLVEDPAEVEEAGRRARLALLQNFDLPIGVDRIIRILERAAPAMAIDEPYPELLRPEHDLKKAS